MKNTKQDKTKLKGFKRLKYATKEGVKAYKRGGDPPKKKKTIRGAIGKTRRLIFGKDSTGFNARVGLIGTIGTAIAAKKIGSNIVKTSENIERATGAIQKTTENIRDSSGRINNGVQKVADFPKEIQNKITNKIDTLKESSKNNLKKLLPKKNKKNYKSFMNNNIAEFTEEQLDEAFEATVEQIQEDFDEGLLTEEEAEDLINNAYEEYEYLNEEFEEESDDDDIEYSLYQNSLANFSSSTALGSTLMAHLVAINPEQPDYTIYQLANTLDLTDEDGYPLEEEDAIEAVLGIISGDYLPHPELLADISDVLELDDEEYNQVASLAIEELFEEGYIDEDDLDVVPEEEYDEEYDNEELQEIAEDIDDVAEVAEDNFSRLQEMEAQFAMAQEQQEIGKTFQFLEREAANLVNSGQMPPYIFEDNYGNFESFDDQMVAFSQVCQSRGVDEYTELYRLESLNEQYANEEPSLNFSRASYADPRIGDYEVDESVVAQAKRNFLAMKSDNSGFGQSLNFGNSNQPNGSGVFAQSTIPSQLNGQLTGNIQPLNDLFAQNIPGNGSFTRTY